MHTIYDKSRVSFDWLYPSVCANPSKVLCTPPPQTPTPPPLPAAPAQHQEAGPQEAPGAAQKEAARPPQLRETKQEAAPSLLQQQHPAVQREVCAEAPEAHAVPLPLQPLPLAQPLQLLRVLGEEAGWIHQATSASETARLPGELQRYPDHPRTRSNKVWTSHHWTGHKGNTSINNLK